MKIGQKFAIITERYGKLIGTLASKNDGRLVFNLADGGYFSTFENNWRIEIYKI